MIAIKIPCKTQHFDYFWLPNLSPEPQKPKKTNEFLMVMLKNHCKTHGFLSMGLRKPRKTHQKLFAIYRNITGLT